jgi:myo-inositol-1(or 4)-monophosphatase
MKKIGQHTQKRTKIFTDFGSDTDILNHMVEWAFECGDLLNHHLTLSYSQDLKLVHKGPQGFATQADLESETFILKKIRQYYPGHEILSEEDAFARKLSIDATSAPENLWLIDPLDGTNNFYNKVPFFCVSLAFNKGRETQVGVVYNPVTCELFYAMKNRGAYLLRVVGSEAIRVKLQVGQGARPFNELLLSPSLTGPSGHRSVVKHFPQVRAMRRFGSAALELSYVAAGMLDGYWEHHLRPWDMAAAVLICQEAGVKVSGINGEKYNPFIDSVLCASPDLHQELLSLLQH